MNQKIMSLIEKLEADRLESEVFDYTYKQYLIAFRTEVKQTDFDIMYQQIRNYPQDKILVVVESDFDSILADFATRRGIKLLTVEQFEAQVTEFTMSKEESNWSQATVSTNNEELLAPAGDEEVEVEVEVESESSETSDINVVVEPETYNQPPAESVEASTNLGNSEQVNPKHKQQKAKGKNKRSRYTIIIVFIVIIVIPLIPMLSKQIQSKREEQAKQQAIENLLDLSDSLSSDGETSYGTSSVIAGAAESLLGKGETQSFSSSDLEAEVTSGEDYSETYQLPVEPGVYTITYASDTESDGVIDFSGNALISYEFYFNNTHNGYYMNEFRNVTIGNDTVLEALSDANDDFTYTFTAQDEYIPFDENDIQPGVYTAGVNIDAGEYHCSSKDGEQLNLFVRNDEYDGNIDINQTHSITLEDGDVIAIDDENTVLEKV